MVEQDWDRLGRFEQDGRKGDAGTYRVEFVRRDEAAGFSAHDLQESLARFWDLHVIGPHRIIEMDFEDPHRNIDDFVKEQYFAFKKKGMIVHPEHGGYSDLAFDMAMDISAGNYATPYRHLRGRYNPVVAGTLFPLAGYYALQTETPVRVFLGVVEKALPHVDQLPQGQAIHDLWKACHPLVRSLAGECARELGQHQLLPTGAVIKNGALREHPVYRWVFSEITRAAELLVDTKLVQELRQVFRDEPPILLGMLALDYCLSCPGDTTNRSFLVEWLAPPCVEFADGKTWLLPDMFRREIVPDIDGAEEQLTEERRQVADSVIDVDRRWEAFRREMRGH